MSRILVTGSAGTLGQPLVRELRARGHEVTGADLRHWPGEIRTDISEYRQVENTFHEVRPDVCYALAGEFGRKNGQDFYEQLWKTNCIGVRNVIEACLLYDVHLIFASSSEAYGDLADHPGTVLSEDLLDNYVPKFFNEYALTKWAGEKQMEIARTHQGLRSTVLRFFNVFGDGEYYTSYRSVVCQFVYKMIHGLPVTIYDGRRDFLYVDDWARTVGNVADRYTKLDGQAINIAGSAYTSILELAQILARKLDYAGEIICQAPEVANVRDKKPSSERAVALLNHECMFTLDEGLDRTISWMKKVYGK